MGVLAPHVAAFSVAMPPGAAVDAGWAGVFGRRRLDRAAPRPVLLVVPADRDGADREHACARARHFCGVVVEGAHQREGVLRLGAVARADALDTVRALRASLAPGTPIIAGGGVHEPKHALDLFGAGADLVSVDSGLVFGGPGLAEAHQRGDALAEAIPGGAQDAEPLRPSRRRE